MTANLLLDCDMAPTRPRCYNRPLARDGDWHPVGRRRGKQVLRWFPRWFVDRCATWDGTGIGPNNERYPEAHGWNCAGCRWLPEGVL